MSEKEIEQYFTLYTMYWKLFKHYSNIDGTEDFWTRLIHEAQAIHEQMQDVDHDLSKELATATVNAIQRSYRKHVKEYDQPEQMNIFDYLEGEQL